MIIISSTQLDEYVNTMNKANLSSSNLSSSNLSENKGNIDVSSQLDILIIYLTILIYKKNNIKDLRHGYKYININKIIYINKYNF
jgi:hypothetical protein